MSTGDTGVRHLRDGVLEGLAGMRRILEGGAVHPAYQDDRIVAKFKSAADALDDADRRGLAFSTNICEDRDFPFCVVRL